MRRSPLDQQLLDEAWDRRQQPDSPVDTSSVSQSAAPPADLAQSGDPSSAAGPSASEAPETQLEGRVLERPAMVVDLSPPPLSALPQVCSHDPGLRHWLLLAHASDS